jgi:uncharacterized protein YndB with AHSA1/START domain
LSRELVKEITINAAPATIFPYLVDPVLMTSWMGTEASLDPRSGGDYRVLCGGVNPAAGEFVEVVTNEKVVFTFGWDLPDHPIPAGSSEVEITLTPQGESTLLRLTHRGLPEDAVTDHGRGWTYYLDRLEVVLSGGNPGPDSPSLES